MSNETSEPRFKSLAAAAVEADGKLALLKEVRMKDSQQKTSHFQLGDFIRVTKDFPYQEWARDKLRVVGIQESAAGVPSYTVTSRDCPGESDGFLHDEVEAYVE